jgi:hypothetical protein
MDEAPKALKPRARVVKSKETQEPSAPVDVVVNDGLEASGSLPVGQSVPRIWAAISFQVSQAYNWRSCLCNRIPKP